MEEEKRLYDKIFIVPQNDLESATIIKILKEHGFIEGENLFVTKQGWGASWENLEDEIKEQVKISTKKLNNGYGPGKHYCIKENITNGYAGGQRDKIVTEDELKRIQNSREWVSDKNQPHDIHWYSGPAVKISERFAEEPDFSIIYGVELQGKTLCNNIDHHVYEGDDRSNPLSSIEQVAQFIGHKLTINEQFIAANDKGYIPAMQELGKLMWMSESEIESKIKEIRAADREVQGAAPFYEQTKEDIKNIVIENGLAILPLSHDRCSCATDLLYGKYDNLLIITRSGGCNFYGSNKFCKRLQEKFGGYSGTGYDNSGYWGNNKINVDLVKMFITGLIDIDKDHTNSVNKDNSVTR